MIIDIVIPVYNGFEPFKQCLYSVLKYPQDHDFNVIVINDASTDMRIARYLKEASIAHDNIAVIEHSENQGFVISVNEGMSSSKGRDVVLLNSDAIVSNQWLDKLVTCAYQKKQIATVTPFSNNATICSFPEVCRPNQLWNDRPVSEIDAAFEKANGGQFVEVPTAVGFCMYIKRQCLDEVGLFDHKQFGKGYGEENDFCMRATEQGWQHVLCADTFVYHSGGESFGSEKDKRLNNAMASLDGKYPWYHGMIQDYIRNDPAKIFRLKALISLARESRLPNLLFVNHNMGGGTEKHLQELGELLRGKANILCVRPHVDSMSIQLSMGIRKGVESVVFQVPSEYGLFLKLLLFIGVDRLHFHHTMGLNPILWGLPEALGIPMDITLHDYYFINANPTMTDHNARFCESPEKRDLLCCEACPPPGNVTADQWRKNQQVLLRQAERIIAPSRYVADIFQSYFPKSPPVVAYHPDWEKDQPYPSTHLKPIRGDHGEMRIVVLGALGREKGADLLEKCARVARQQHPHLKFHLIGYAYRTLDAAVVTCGAYDDSELQLLIQKANPHLIWFPATWPETYSYTLSAALNSRLPVVAPNIGAFPERLKNRPMTWIIPWDISVDKLMVLFTDIRRRCIEVKSTEQRLYHWPGQASLNEGAFSYSNTYLETTKRNPSRRANQAYEAESNAFFDEIHSRFQTNKRDLSFAEQVLTVLVKMRRLKWVAVLTRPIPYHLQRTIKRSLSKRPIHDLVLEDIRRQNWPFGS